MSTRLEKLTGKRAYAAFEKLGFRLVRRDKKGRTYRTDGDDPILVGIDASGYVPPRLWSCVLRDLGMSEEDLFRLLKAS